MPTWPSKVKNPNTATAEEYSLTSGSVLFFDSMRYLIIWFQNSGATDYVVYDLAQSYYTKIEFDNATNKIKIGGAAVTTDNNDTYDATRHNEVFFEQNAIIGTTDVRDAAVIQIKNIYNLAVAPIMVKRISSSSFDVKFVDNDTVTGKKVFSLN